MQKQGLIVGVCKYSKLHPAVKYLSNGGFSQFFPLAFKEFPAQLLIFNEQII
jgi:hypothetical protein